MYEMRDNDEIYSPRNNKSLNFLTKKFVELIREAEDGIISLQDASMQLDVKQKRRIYDITNVLEGIGLITKRSKNTVQWRGTQNDNSEISGELQSELEKLEEEEAQLKKMCDWARQNINNCLDDPVYKSLNYVTRDDLLEYYPESVVLAVKNYQKMQQLPTIEGHTLTFGRGLKFSSTERPIDVFLVTDNGRSTVKTDPNEADDSDDKKEMPTRTKQNGSDDIPFHFQLKQNNRSNSYNSWLEYKKMANTLLNCKVNKYTAQRRRKLRNFYQAKEPLVKLSDSVRSTFQFSLDKTEGITDLFDIPLGSPET